VTLACCGQVECLPQFGERGTDVGEAAII